MALETFNGAIKLAILDPDGDALESGEDLEFFLRLLYKSLIYASQKSQELNDELMLEFTVDISDAIDAAFEETL